MIIKVREVAYNGIVTACNWSVISGLNRIKSVKLGTGFRLSKQFSSVGKHQFKKIIFDYDPIIRYEFPYDTHPGDVINRVKLDVFTLSSFGDNYTDRENCAL